MKARKRDAERSVRDIEQQMLSIFGMDEPARQAAPSVAAAQAKAGFKSKYNKKLPEI